MAKLIPPKTRSTLRINTIFSSRQYPPTSTNQHSPVRPHQPQSRTFIITKAPTMSYEYLRHSRRPSQRIPPPKEPNTIDTILDLQTRTSHQLFKTQILNSIPPESLTTDLEPLPTLDYHLLYLLIKLARPYLNRRDLKRYDYLAEARKYYFIGQSKFQDAYVELLAASTHGKMLDAQFNELAQSLNTNQDHTTSPSNPQITNIPTRLATIELARRLNNEDLRHHLLALDQRAKARDYATAWLSSLKWKFLQTEMPGLVAMGKQIHAYRMGKSGTLLSRTPV